MSPQQQKIGQTSAQNGSYAVSGNVGRDLNICCKGDNNMTQEEASKAFRTALHLDDPLIVRERITTRSGSRVEGTCEWILRNSKYRKWLCEGAPLLWITGSTGKGKTIMSTFLAGNHDALVKTDKCKHAASYFCDQGDEECNTDTRILQNLIHQIVSSQEQLIRHVIPYFESKDRTKETLLSFETLWVIFQKIVLDHDFETTYCVLDGIDECDNKTLKTLIPRLVDILNVDSSRAVALKFRLLVVSRDDPGTVALRSCPRLRLEDHDEEINEDIRRFVGDKVQQLSSYEGFDKIRDSVESRLSTKAAGTFLWVGFAMNELLQTSTCSEVLKILDCLPKGLHKLFDRIIQRIPKDRRSLCSKTLRWVTMALRPMSLPELAAATYFESPHAVLGDQAFSDAIKPCQALLRVQKHRVTLIHRSVRDYLTQIDNEDDCFLKRSQFQFHSESAHYELAERCLQCIDELKEEDVRRNCPDDFTNEFNITTTVAERGLLHLENGPSSPLTNIRGLFLLPHYSRTRCLKGSPLIDYAVEHMPQHAEACSSQAKKLMQKSRLFFTQETTRQFWLRLYKKKGLFFFNGGSMPSPSPLQIASYFGITVWAEALLPKDSSRSLRWLSFKRKRPNPSLCDPGPLLLAVQQQHSAIVRLLIAAGADVNSVGKGGLRALHFAVLSGNEKIVHLLIRSHADTNAKSTTTFTRVTSKSDDDRSQTQTVISTPHSVRDRSRSTTPLHLAAVRGYLTIAQLLVEAKADVNAEGSKGRTPLDLAVWTNNTSIAGFLKRVGGASNDKMSPLYSEDFEFPAPSKTPSQQFLVDWRIERLESDLSSNSERSISTTFSPSDLPSDEQSLQGTVHRRRMRPGTKTMKWSSDTLSDGAECVATLKNAFRMMSFVSSHSSGSSNLSKRDSYRPRRKHQIAHVELKI